MDADVLLAAALQIAASAGSPDDAGDAVHWLADRLAEFEGAGGAKPARPSSPAGEPTTP